MMPLPLHCILWYRFLWVHIPHCGFSETTMRRMGRSTSLSLMSTPQAQALTSTLPRTLSRWTPATPTARRLMRSPRSAAGAAAAGPRLQGEPMRRCFVSPGKPCWEASRGPSHGWPAGHHGGPPAGWRPTRRSPRGGAAQKAAHADCQAFMPCRPARSHLVQEGSA